MATDEKRWGIARWAPVASLLTLAGLLRLYRLDDQLWLDEIGALVHGYRKPVVEILTTGHGFWHPLYQLLAHASLVTLGESPLTIRLPAALFGVAGVLMFYKLARRVATPGEALLASGLLAVSYHHVFFSQDARGYTALLFFTLASTDLLLSLLDTARHRTALAYAAVAALAAYAHPFGIFVPVGHTLVALPVAYWRRRRGNLAAPSLPSLVGVAVLTHLTIVLLYAPFIRDSIAFSLTTARTAGHGPRVYGLLPELLEGLRAAFFGWSGVILLVALGVVGTLHLLRRHPVAVAALLCPALVAAAAVAFLGVGVHARYFLVTLPLGYLVATRGLVVGGRALCRRLPLPASGALRVQQVLAVLVVVVAALPLARYYAVPKQDNVGALQQVQMLADGDRALAVHLAGHAIRDYYAPDFPVVEDLPGLLREEASGGRLWVVTTLERELSRHDPALLAYLRQYYRLVRVLPGTVGDGAMRIYVREVAPRTRGDKASG